MAQVTEQVSQDTKLQPSAGVQRIAREGWSDNIRARGLLAKAVKKWPSESSLEYCAFREYAFLGVIRSFDRVITAVGRDLDWVTETSRLYRWEERVAAYDEACALVAARAHATELERMGERQARYGRLAQAKAALVIRSKPLAAIRAGEAAAMLRVGTDIERLARGAATRREEKKVLILTASFGEAANVKKHQDDRDRADGAVRSSSEDAIEAAFTSVPEVDEPDEVNLPDPDEGDAEMVPSLPDDPFHPADEDGPDDSDE